MANKLTYTIDPADIGSDLTDFPVVVQLDSSSGKGAFDTTGIFTELPNAGDWKYIHVTDASGTELYCEVENWDVINEKATLHVKVPTVSSSADTVLTLDYNSTNADNSANIGVTGSTPSQQVWNSNFVAVYHMAQDPSGTAPQILDSTSNANHGTSNGTMTSGDLIDAAVGKALYFDGNSYIDFGNDSAFDTINTVEFSFLNISGTTSGWGGIISKYSADYDRLEFYVTPSYNVPYQLTSSLSPTSNYKESTTWHTYSYTNTGIHQECFIDGLYEAFSSAGVSPTLAASGSFRVGAYFYQNSPKEMTGSIGEVRISNIVRSDDWIKLTNLSLTDQLFYIAPATSDGSVQLTLDQPISMLRTLVKMLLDQPINIRKILTTELNQPVSMVLQLSLHQPVGVAPVVTLELDQWIHGLRLVTLSLAQPIGVCPPVRLSLDQPCTLPALLVLSLSQPIVIAGQKLTLALNQPVTLSVNNGTVTLALDQPCSFNNSSSITSQIALSVTVGGRLVDPDYVSLRADDGDAFMTSTIRFPDYAQYAACEVGEQVVITETLDSNPPEITILQVESLTNPEAPGAADHIITAISPTIILNDELLTEDLGPGVAAGLLTALCTMYGITLDWQGVVEWPILTDDLTANDETVFDLLRNAAAASGAFLQSLPDGGMRLRPEYGESTDNWEDAAAELELNDHDHIFSISEQADPRDGYNAFLISGASQSASTSPLEVIDLTATTKEVRYYMSPWDSEAEVILGHTGGDWVSIDAVGTAAAPIVETIEAEEAEIVAGIGSVKYPIDTLLVATYHEDSLGQVRGKYDGSLSTEIEGDALLNVDYRTKYLSWIVTDPKAESLQIFIN